MWLQDTNDLTCRVKKNLGDGKVLFKGKIILVRLAMESLKSTCDTVYTFIQHVCTVATVVVQVVGVIVILELRHGTEYTHLLVLMNNYRLSTIKVS